VLFRVRDRGGNEGWGKVKCVGNFIAEPPPLAPPARGRGD